ncbi:50S ribosomal protein L17 [Lewinella cohaerens]|uniref:50S ribosomal protein L17 n=1 Tax=Lewinella cohaerens TaxID=70995 RepID=UPI000379819F
MRHGKKFNHLGRKVGHRKALLRNLAISLIEYKRINTTLAKAKALRVFVEPIVTKAKTDSTHNRRVVFSYLQNKEAVKELFGDVAKRIGDRPGGYVRIIKTGTRKGDAAEMAMIEFVDFNEVYTAGSEASKGGGRRRRRGGKGKGAKAAAAATTTAAASQEEE